MVTDALETCERVDGLYTASNIHLRIGAETRTDTSGHITT